MASLAGGLALGLAAAMAGAGSAHAQSGGPTTPGNFRAEVGTSSVTVEWDPSSSDAGVTIYYILLDGRWHWSTQPEITFFLAQDRTFRMQVQAQDGAWRRSAWSDPFEFRTPDVAPVTTPGNVRVSEAPGSLTVQWDPSASDAGVLDYTTTVRGGTGGPVARRTSGPTATFSIPPGGDLDVTVQARDRAYRYSDQTGVVPASVPPAEGWSPPAAPKNLSAEFDSRNRVELVRWDAGGGGGGATVTYHLKLDGDEVESTRQLELELFSFARCPDGARNTLSFTVSATANGFESPDSEPITLCFD